jgi:hypothetical protein
MVERSPLSPTPSDPESPRYEYITKQAENPTRKGPLRFQEGLGTDTDIPNSFVTGALQGYETPPGRLNQNKKVDTKDASETMAERAHVGSASWPEAPEFLSGFVDGTGRNAEQKFIADIRDGGHYERPNYARIPPTGYNGDAVNYSG